MRFIFGCTVIVRKLMPLYDHYHIGKSRSPSMKMGYKKITAYYIQKVIDEFIDIYIN